MCEDVVKVHKSFPVFYDKAWFLLYTGYIFCKKKKKKKKHTLMHWNYRWVTIASASELVCALMAESAHKAAIWPIGKLSVISKRQF